MIRIIVLSAMLALSACKRETRTAFAFPTLPDLSAEARRPCPPLPEVTGALGDLAAKDAAASLEYARCQARHRTAVAAYDDAQRLLKLAADQTVAITGGSSPAGPMSPKPQ